MLVNWSMGLNLEFDRASTFRPGFGLSEPATDGRVLLHAIQSPQGSQSFSSLIPQTCSQA